jgi:hypothetical protein
LVPSRLVCEADILITLFHRRIQGFVGLSARQVLEKLEIKATTKTGNTVIILPALDTYQKNILPNGKKIVCRDSKVKNNLPLGKKILTLLTLNLKIIFHENNN